MNFRKLNTNPQNAPLRPLTTSSLKDEGGQLYASIPPSGGGFCGLRIICVKACFSRRQTHRIRAKLPGILVHRTQIFRETKQFMRKKFQNLDNTSNILRKESNILFKRINILFNIFNVLFNISKILFKRSDILRKTFNVLFNISKILFKRSDILRKILDLRDK